MQKISGQKLWLDEGMVHATKFLSTFIKKEEFRELSQAEEKFKQLEASYLYLYHKAKEHGLLDEDTLDNFFTDEIIH